MNLREEIMATAEIMGGRPMSDLAAAALLAELQEYPVADVRAALSRLKRDGVRLTLPAIRERLPGAPLGPDAAWAICSRAYDENASVVWTDAMALAFGEVRAMDDRVAARMAFREIYQRHQADERGVPKWSISKGHDRGQHAAAVYAGIAAGRLPGSASTYGVLPRGVEEVALLSLPSGESMDPGEIAEQSAAVLRALGGGQGL